MMLALLRWGRKLDELVLRFVVRIKVCCRFTI